jgi:hypothetical protein
MTRPSLRRRAGAAMMALCSAATLTPIAYAHGQAPTTACIQASPIDRQQGLVRAAVAQGWKVTPAGAAVLRGRLPVASVDSEVFVQGSATLAIAPKGRTIDLGALRAAAGGGPPMTQWRQRPARPQAYSYVYLNCGIGQQANVNFYLYPSAFANVRWNLVNFSTGASGNKNSNSHFCPSNSGGCIEYFYIVPAAPWYVFAAEEWSSIGAPSPLTQYCGG